MIDIKSDEPIWDYVDTTTWGSNVTTQTLTTADLDLPIDYKTVSKKVTSLDKSVVAKSALSPPSLQKRNRFRTGTYWRHVETGDVVKIMSVRKMWDGSELIEYGYYSNVDHQKVYEEVFCGKRRCEPEVCMPEALFELTFKQVFEQNIWVDVPHDQKTDNKEIVKIDKHWELATRLVTKNFNQEYKCEWVIEDDLSELAHYDESLVKEIDKAVLDQLSKSIDVINEQIDTVAKISDPIKALDAYKL